MEAIHIQHNMPSKMIGLISQVTYSFYFCDAGERVAIVSDT